MHMEKAKYTINYNNGDQIKLQKGNTKLGKKVFTFNTLPGEHPLTLKEIGRAHV